MVPWRPFAGTINAQRRAQHARPTRRQSALAFERARTSTVAGMTFTWIITGASGGLGRAITERALAAGDRVIAATRRPATLNDLTGDLRAVTFDAGPSQIVAAADGRVDVLVNNAGRGIV